MYDVLILGTGPAAITAAIYTTRYNMKTLVIGKGAGMISHASEVENYPGIYPVTGPDLMNKFIEHAKALNIEITYETITDISKDNDVFTVKTNKGEYKGKTIIYALGGEKRKTGLPEESKYEGKGISYCATCDGFFFKGKDVVVAGGGNGAALTTILLSKIAKKIYLIYRGEKLKAFPSLIERIEKFDNVEIILNSNIVKIKGDNFVSSIIIEDNNGQQREINVNGIFVEYGYNRNSEFAEKIGVELDKPRRIIVKQDMSTNIKGFFAAGDVTNGSDGFGQVITACAEGAIAARSAYNYIIG